MKKNDCILWEWKIPGLQKLLRVMKLSIFMLLLSVFSVFAEKTYSQSNVLNLNAENTTVKEVLRNIEEQTEFYFMYSEKIVDVNREVSVNVKNQKIDKVLKQLFTGTNVKFTVKDRFILLTVPQSELNGNVQQEKSISGFVTDETGLPLPGAAIIIKGTTIGTITDIDGKFSLNKVPANTTLVFSFMGMKTQEISIGNKDVLNIELSASGIDIDEVVVTALGIKRDTKSLGYAVQEIKANEIIGVKGSNFTDALSGRIAGLNVTSNSGVGSSTRIILRGESSMNYPGAEPTRYQKRVS